MRRGQSEQQNKDSKQQKAGSVNTPAYMISEVPNPLVGEKKSVKVALKESCKRLSAQLYHLSGKCSK